MTDLYFNSSEIFGTNFQERRLTKRAKKAMVNELVLPEDSYEMTYEDECETTGGNYFVGINMSATQTRGFYEWVLSKSQGSGLTGTALMGFAFACFKCTPYYSALASAVSAIPVVGWVALGIIAISAATIATAVFNHGRKNQAFRLGFNVKTFWGIPRGVSFICE